MVLLSGGASFMMPLRNTKLFIRYATTKSAAMCSDFLMSMIYGFIRRSLGEGGFCGFTVYGLWLELQTANR
jgi:hypothetical protein